MKPLKAALVAVFLSAAPAAYADLKQVAIDRAARGAEQLAESTHSFLAKAQSIGFLVDEVRFEMSLTPKVEVYFRDTGDNGRFDAVVANSSGFEEAGLRALQATRRFSVAHYSPTGIKLVTGAAVPKVEILTTFQE